MSCVMIGTTKSKQVPNLCQTFRPVFGQLFDEKTYQRASWPVRARTAQHEHCLKSKIISLVPKTHTEKSLFTEKPSCLKSRTGL